MELIDLICYQLNYKDLTSITCTNNKVKLIADNPDIWITKISIIREDRHHQFINKPLAFLKYIYKQISRSGFFIVKGSNKYGQLGLGDRVNREDFSPLPFTDVIGVSCGEFSMSFITAKGQYYTCGEAHSPFIHNNNHWLVPQIPQSLQSFNNILQISAGYYYSAFVTDQGECYISSIGDIYPIRLVFEGLAIQVAVVRFYMIIITIEGYCYQTNLENCHEWFEQPELVRILDDEKITKVGCTKTYIAYLSSRGQIYVQDIEDNDDLGPYRRIGENKKIIDIICDNQLTIIHSMEEMPQNNIPNYSDLFIIKETSFCNENRAILFVDR